MDEIVAQLGHLKESHFPFKRKMVGDPRPDVA